VEASLDIDFDILFTELSDLNGLFQRLGRCYRSRPFKEEGYNCYVFDGGDKKCNGVGNFIDERIFELSKEALQSIDGPLCEKTKMKLVSELYTTANLKGSDYYTKIKENLEYVKAFQDLELSKGEAKERFRDIKSTTVIPKGVYDINEEKIEGYRRILLEEYPPEADEEERKAIRKRKIIARNDLMQFTVSILTDKVSGNVVKELKLSKYEAIPIFNCKYSPRLGVEYLEKQPQSKKRQ